MSLITKLQTALSVVFILTIAGALSVTAQTQVAPGHSTINATTTAPTTEAQKAELPEPSAAPAENSDQIASEKTAKVSRLDRYNNPFAFAAAPSAKPATFTGAKAPRSPQVIPDEWVFQVTPYFWLASLHGTGGVGNRTVQVDESFGDVWHALDFALMGTFEARKGHLVVLVDTEYVAVSDDRATPGPFFSDVNAKFKTFIFDPEAGYRVYNDPDKGAFIDVLGGVRIWHVSTELDFGAGILPATQLQGARTWVDGIFGLRGGIALSEKAFVTGKLDLGGGGSKFTWQTFGGLGYNIKPNIALIGGYRVLDVNYSNGGFIYDMNQRGPIMGLGFKF